MAPLLWSALWAIFLMGGASKPPPAVIYSDLEHLGVACPLKDSCAQNGGTNFTDRNCECDRHCAAFGDCCVDAESTPSRYRSSRYRSHGGHRFRTGRLHCVPFGEGEGPNLGVYAVDNCPHDVPGEYRTALGLRAKCSGEPDFGDPLMAAPATDTAAGVTYKNRYCAECNGASPNRLVSWLIHVHCESPALQGVNDSLLWRRMGYDGDHDAWGVNMDGEFHACDLTYDKPDYIKTGYRFCRANAISTCPHNWRRLPVRRACDAYMAVVYDAEHSYKNVHCAICNGKVVNHVSCYGDGISTRQKSKSFSFALLLDVNRSDGDIVGVSQKCPEGQKYDPFFKKCRMLKCALPGFKMVDGKCKKG